MGCGEVTTASIGAKGDSSPSLVAMGKANDSTVVTKRHGGVHTVAWCMLELQRAHGYGELGQSKGFALSHLYGEVRGLKEKLYG